MPAFSQYSPQVGDNVCGHLARSTPSKEFAKLESVFSTGVLSPAQLRTWKLPYRIRIMDCLVQDPEASNGCFREKCLKSISGT